MNKKIILISYILFILIVVVITMKMKNQNFKKTVPSQKTETTEEKYEEEKEEIKMPLQYNPIVPERTDIPTYEEEREREEKRENIGIPVGKFDSLEFYGKIKI
ncbi:MAG: hypothetical protein NC934_05715 [Candidatus Omnitrophica bacterium]|nr:hypothetical protein [Candidatus Omnitrophota bacterium]